MKIIKWIVILFLLVLFGLNCYVGMATAQGISKSGVLLICCMLAVVLKRGSVYWWLGLLLFVYGLYNLFFIGTKAAEPTIMEFTSPVSYFFFRHKVGNLWRYVIGLIPLGFYLSGFIFLLSKHGRKYYFENR